MNFKRLRKENIGIYQRGRVSKMVCDKCSEKGYFMALSEGVCKVCSCSVTTPHASPYLICKECSNKYELCQQCGVKMVEEDV